MVHIGLRKMPLRRKRVQIEKAVSPRVITISLIHPPLFYKKTAPQKAKIISAIYQF